jgi:hypothetical protein
MMSSSAEMLVRRFCPWNYTLKRGILPNSLTGKNSFLLDGMISLIKLLQLLKKENLISSGS